MGIQEESRQSTIRLKPLDFQAKQKIVLGSSNNLVLCDEDNSVQRIQKSKRQVVLPRVHNTWKPSEFEEEYKKPKFLSHLKDKLLQVKITEKKLNKTGILTTQESSAFSYRNKKISEVIQNRQQQKNNDNISFKDTYQETLDYSNSSINIEEYNLQDESTNNEGYYRKNRFVLFKKLSSMSESPNEYEYSMKSKSCDKHMSSSKLVQLWNINYDQQNSLNQQKKQQNSNGIEEIKKEQNCIKKEENIKGNKRKWKMGNLLGAGNFGQVFRALDIKTGEMFAVKRIPIANSSLIGNSDQLSKFEEELNLLQKLNHKHVVEYQGHEFIEDYLQIYLKYMSGGNISNILQKYGALEEDTIKIYSRQILEGLEYLHQNKIIHKDIKCDNILVDSDGTVCLADFGCSMQIDKTLSAGKCITQLKGSIPWMAPEVIKQSLLSRSSDIWSFGCTVLEMATAQIPWSNYKFDNHIAALIKIGASNDIPLIPEHLSHSLQSFIKACLHRDPSQRLNANQLINHDFLKT